MPTQASSTRKWWALALIAAAQFMVIMDTSIIGIALPKMQTDLGFSQENLTWVFNAYVIAFGGLLLLGGRLSDLWGARRTFATGWVVLLVGSITAAAGNVGTELAGRAVQGAGAALIAPSALTLLMMLFGSTQQELTKALAVYGAAAPAGGTAGVFLGGVITEYLSWPWVFYINIPIAVIALAATPLLMPNAPTRSGSIDILGALTVTAGLALAVYSIVRAPEVGWDSGQTWGYLAVSAVLLGAFVLIQSRRREPLMRLGIFTAPNLAAANVAQLLLGAAWIPMWFFLNLYLQQVLGYSAFPRRRSTTADDHIDHARHDRHRAAGDAEVRGETDDRDRSDRSRARARVDGLGPAHRQLLGRRAAGFPGRRSRYVARLHPLLGHGDLRRPTR